MDYITQIELANFEMVEPPKVERSNFAYSFTFLPKEERDAICSVYAFCSYIDDIVDNETEKGIQKKHERLNWWSNVIEKIYSGEVQSHLLKPLEVLINRFEIPKQYFLTLIDGCRSDLVKNRYETFEDLKEYCYGVAGVVGLISIEIFGHKYEETKNYAINLGYALQLTNILRDVKPDKDRNYIYLPQEDMKRFNYSEEELFGEVYNQNFIDLMRFEAKRAREFLLQSQNKPESR